MSYQALFDTRLKSYSEGLVSLGLAISHFETTHDPEIMLHIANLRGVLEALDKRYWALKGGGVRC